MCECHGSIHYLQCLKGCTNDIWPAEGFDPVVDKSGCRLVSDLPTCPHCGALARPAILMFGDWQWNAKRFEERKANLDAWLTAVRRLVIIEIGAGIAIPTVRHFGEFQKGFLIRINLSEPKLPTGCLGVGLAMSGIDALRRIHSVLVGDES